LVVKFYIFEFRNKALNKIDFYDFNAKSNLLHKRLLKNFLFKLFEEQKQQIEKFDIIFCDDQYLRSLNKKFLNHDYYTDTLTFNLTTGKENRSGEAYISIDRVKDNAKSFGLKYQAEIVRVIIHCCLHICGYNDKSRKDLNKMNKIQDTYLRKWIDCFT
jgi:rRNA maturation RNase YbeY